MRFHNKKIRLARSKDLAKIVAIYNSTIPTRMSTADVKEASVSEKLSWFKKHSSKRPIIVYEEKNEIVGWASFEEFYGRPAYHITAELSIYVDSKYRRMGIGTELLTECIKLCPELRIRNLIGYVFAHNEPSIKLLKKHNFKRWA